MLLFSEVNSLRTWSILSSVRLTRSPNDRIHSTLPSSSLWALVVRSRWVVSFLSISRRRNQAITPNSAAITAPAAPATQASTVGNSTEMEVAHITQATIHHPTRHNRSSAHQTRGAPP